MCKAGFEHCAVGHDEESGVERPSAMTEPVEMVGADLPDEDAHRVGGAREEPNYRG